MTVVDERRIFFVHLQKTAGTSLVSRLREVLGNDAVYPPKDVADVGWVIDVDRLAAEWPARRDAVRVVTGHFPYCASTLLGDDLATVTVLRDPVERTLSYLRHHRKLTPADRDLPLEQIYEDPFRFDAMIHNHMVKMLSLDPVEMTGGMLTVIDLTEAHLGRAKANLRRIDLVGVQEDAGAFWTAFIERFGIDLGPLAFANRTEPVPVSDAFRRRIEADNPLDVELYHDAVELVGARA